MRRAVVLLLAVAITAGCGSAPGAPDARKTNGSARPTASGLPSAGRVLARYPLPAGPAGLAYQPGSLWAVSPMSSTLTAIDLESGKTRHSIQVNGEPTTLAYAFGEVWVAAYASATVTRVNTLSGRILGTTTVGRAPLGFGVLPNHLWVSNQADGSASVLATDGRVVQTVQLNGVAGGAPVANGDRVWIADVAGGTTDVWSIDPSLGSLTMQVDVGATPIQLAFGMGSGWVTTTNALVRFDPRSGAVQARISDLGTQLTGVAVTADAVWVDDAASGAVIRLDPATNKATGAVTGLAGPGQIIAVGGDLFVVEATGAAVARIHPVSP